MRRSRWSTASPGPTANSSRAPPTLSADGPLSLSTTRPSVNWSSEEPPRCSPVLTESWPVGTYFGNRQSASVSCTAHLRKKRRDLPQLMRHRVRLALGVAVLLGRDRAVRHMDGPKAGVVGTPHVVEQPVTDVHAAARVGGTDGLHRGTEGVRRGLRPGHLAGV